MPASRPSTSSTPRLKRRATTIQPALQMAYSLSEGVLPECAYRRRSTRTRRKISRLKPIQPSSDGAIAVNPFRVNGSPAHDPCTNKIGEPLRHVGVVAVSPRHRSIDAFGPTGSAALATTLRPDGWPCRTEPAGYSPLSVSSVPCRPEEEPVHPKSSIYMTPGIR